MIIDHTDLNEMVTLAAGLRARKFRVGLTSGCFDLTHYLHLVYLEKCRRECDFLVVGVDADALIRGFKDKNPVFPEHQRAAMINALKCVDAVFIMSSLGHFDLVSRAFQVDFIFKNKPVLYGKKIVGRPEAKVVVIPDVEIPTSTTAIVSRLQARKR